MDGMSPLGTLVLDLRRRRVSAAWLSGERGPDRVETIILRQATEPVALQGGSEAVCDPLDALSSAASLAPSHLRNASFLETKRLVERAHDWLQSLLDPVFEGAAAYRPDDGRFTAVVAVPGRLGRRALRVLEELLRVRGFSRVLAVRRELAASLLTLGEGTAGRALVVDCGEHDLRLHHVVIERDLEGLGAGVVASRTKRDLGWSFLLGRLADLLGDHLGGEPGSRRARLEEALTAPEVRDGSPPSAGASLDRAIRELGDDRLQKEIGERLAWAAADLGFDARIPWVGIGPAFCTPAVGRLLETALGVQGRAIGTAVPALERPIQGLAAAVAELVPGGPGVPASRLSLEAEHRLWLSNLEDTGIELAGAGDLIRRAREARPLRRFMRLEGEPRNGDGVPIRLHWGADPDPRSSALVAAASLDPRRLPAGDEREIEVRLDLRAATRGRLPTGTVRARLGEACAESRLEIPNFARSLESRDFPWAPAAEPVPSSSKEVST